MHLIDTERHVDQRRRMVEFQLRRRGIEDERVLGAMASVPRHYFVDEDKQAEAYADHPVTIGLGQTVSQPYIVALMTEALRLRQNHRVLEIGTGCGYQTAILAKLVSRAYTVEIRRELSSQAEQRLLELGITNVDYFVGDGHDGWPEGGEFDGILVAAAGERVPDPLVDQLTEGGRMVIPVGPLSDQRLLMLEKRKDGLREELLCHCRFVKLIRASRPIA